MDVYVSDWFSKKNSSFFVYFIYSYNFYFYSSHDYIYFSIYTKCYSKLVFGFLIDVRNDDYLLISIFILSNSYLNYAILLAKLLINICLGSGLSGIDYALILYFNYGIRSSTILLSFSSTPKFYLIFYIWSGSLWSPSLLPINW